jgi:sirohydrochlorin ferrochelatase
MVYLIRSMGTGIIIVDHGSRKAESNLLLESVAAAFAKRFAERFPIVEPAHMELSPPSIADAFANCVRRGAMHIIVVPYFLGPGKHWTHDIPNLAAAAAKDHAGTTFHVARYLGLDDAMLDLLARRAAEMPEG